jgi:hypothetical protein
MCLLLIQVIKLQVFQLFMRIYKVVYLDTK